MGPLVRRIADATPAALARLTAHGSLPISIDEAEPSNTWVMDLFALMRIASGAEGLRIRADGGSSDGVQVQAPRFSAMLSATATPRLGMADASRLTHVKLGLEVDDWPGVSSAIKAAMEHADNVRSSIIRDAAKIADRASAITAELQGLGLDSREALAQGALTAGWHWWGVDDLDVSASEEEEPERSDAADCLITILAYTMRTPGGAGVTIAHTLAAGSVVPADLYGIIYDERGLLLASGHPGLAHVLRGTPWAKTNLRDMLMQLTGVTTTTNAIHVGEFRKRCILLPPHVLERLGIDIDIGGEE